MFYLVDGNLFYITAGKNSFYLQDAYGFSSKENAEYVAKILNREGANYKVIHLSFI